MIDVMKRSALGLLSSLLLVLMIINSAIQVIMVEGKQVAGGEVDLLAPISDLVSGSVWLTLNKLDPIHAEGQYRKYMLQASEGEPVKIPFRKPSPKFSRNLIVSYSVGRYPYQTEPCIAVNPANPDNLIMALDDYNFYGDAVYVSMDGGVSWKGPIAMKVLIGDEWGGNPALAFDRKGNAYFAQMSIGYRWVQVFDKAFTVEIASIALYRSSDGGLTWSDPTVAVKGTVYVSSAEKTLTLTFIDRPWMTIGLDPKDPVRDNVYLTYTEFAMHYPIIEEYPYLGSPEIEVTIKLARSTDGGLTFSSPVAVSPTYKYYLGGEQSRIVQGSQSAVAPDGTLYVTYYDSLDDGPWNGLFAPTVTWSKDGGLTFSKPVTIDFKHEFDYWLPPTLFRAWTSMSPRIAVGPEGNVYVVFAANPLWSEDPDDSDIFFSRSIDGGRSWSKPVRINDDLTKRDQFFPSIGVSRNGTVHVAFADRRDDPVDVRYNIYYTRSNDHGETWLPNSRVSDYPSNPNFGIPFFLGDYFSIAVSDEDVYIAWTDTRLGRLGYPSSNVALTRMRSMPSPSIHISPSFGPAGTSVTVTGFNFTPNHCKVYIEFEGMTLASALTDENGSFTTTVLIPVSGEGSHTVRAIDATGNFAETAFHTEIGFGTLEDVMKRLNASESRVAAENFTESLGVINRTLTEKLEDFTSKVEAELSGLATLINVSAILAVTAIVLSIVSMIVTFRRRYRTG